MAGGETGSIFSVRFFPNFKGDVAISNHMLDFVPTKERGHENEVEKKKRPIDLDVCLLKAAAKGG